MMGSRAKIWTIVAAVSVLTIVSGCRIVSPGVTYNMGSLEAMISATPEEVTGATEAIVQDMKLVLISSESTGLDGKVIARTAQNKKISIDIKRQSQNVTHVTIRVGRMGDEQASMLILERIKSRL